MNKFSCLASGMLALIVSGRLFAPVYSALPADAEEKTTTMAPYTEPISGTDVKIEMVPIPAGEFLLGSPDGEADRGDDEGPQVKVKIDAFWMAKYETTWEQYEQWMFSLEWEDRKRLNLEPTEHEVLADAVTRPTKPYTDMTFNMGRDGYPAISMTQLAAKMYCQWLSAKTGHYYRLPTEAEWEYACRAGTTTAYSFGDNADQLEEYGWFFDNGEDKTHKVGEKKPNPWGLYDMHGNVAEWCLDQYHEDGYHQITDKKMTENPVMVPTELYPRSVRGGSWDDDPDKLRSAARRGSHEDWKVQDPQIPKSVWYHTDAKFLGFRIVRPLKVPTPEERKKLGFDPVIPKGARTAKVDSGKDN